MNRPFPKKTSRWLTDTIKDAQHHSLLGICKSKLQWNINSHLSECLKSAQEISNVDKEVEKREPTCSVGKSANWCSNYGKEHGSPPQNKKKQKFMMIQDLCCWIFIQKYKNNNSHGYMNPYVYCSINNIYIFIIYIYIYIYIYI